MGKLRFPSFEAGPFFRDPRMCQLLSPAKIVPFEAWTGQIMDKVRSTPTLSFALETLIKKERTKGGALKNEGRDVVMQPEFLEKWLS